MTYSRSISFALCFLVSVFNAIETVDAQRPTTKKKTENAVIKGKIEFAKKLSKSWKGDQLVVAFPEIKAKLRQYVTLPPPPYPRGHQRWTSEQRVAWERKFAQSAEGKKVIERNKKLLEAGNSFDIKFEKDGSFVVYDVPTGDYAIQGRLDKEINRSVYAFEVFGELSVRKDVDEMVLEPIRVEVTPQYARGVAAPPVKVTSWNDKESLSMDNFKGHTVLINFWSVESPVAAKEQQLLQQTYEKLKSDKFRLLSINVDKDRKKALQLLSKNKLLKGSHGFTLGRDQATTFNFGVRSVPSYWLIDKDGKILMNQYEFSKLMRIKPNFETIIKERVTGKDTPTPAKRPSEKNAGSNSKK